MRDFNIAFAKNDRDFKLQWISGDVEWNRIGSDHIVGKENFAAALTAMTGEPAIEIIIENIITHGKIAAANGTIKFSNRGAYAFCDVYEFSSHGKNAKIKAITSYVLAV